MATVLLVEDDQHVRQTLARVLRAEGFAVIEACSADDAVAAVALDPVDVLVTDLRLPGRPGDTLTAELQDILGARLPAVLLTGILYRDTQGIFDLVLTKPVASDELIRAVRKVMA